MLRHLRVLYYLQSLSWVAACKPTHIMIISDYNGCVRRRTHGHLSNRAAYSWQRRWILITAAGVRRKSGLMGFRDADTIGGALDWTLKGGYDGTDKMPPFGRHRKPDVARLRDVIGHPRRSISVRHSEAGLWRVRWRNDDGIVTISGSELRGIRQSQKIAGFCVGMGRQDFASDWGRRGF